LTGKFSCYHILSPVPHTSFLQSSPGVLLHLGDRVDKENIKKFPFVQYAAQHWVDRGQLEDVLSKIQDSWNVYLI
jgi:hypothetical protein